MSQLKLSVCLSQRATKAEETVGVTTSEKKSYSQTTPRAPRRPSELPPHLERGTTRCRRGTKRDAVEVGALTVERIVSGKYEWRDAEYAPMKGPRKRLWDTWHA